MFFSFLIYFFKRMFKFEIESKIETIYNQTSNDLTLSIYQFIAKVFQFNH